MTTAPLVGRHGLGAPNEAKFGFVQSTRVGGVIHVAGQVGKDNRSGAMLPAATFRDHVANALDNVREAAALALTADERPTIVAATVHVPRRSGRRLADELDAIASSPVLPWVVVGVPALASPDYEVEISATALARPDHESRHSMFDRSVNHPEPVRRWLPGHAACRVGQWVFAGGHVALDDEQRPRPAAVAEEVADAIGALSKSLRAVDADLDRVTSMHLYVVGGDPPLDFDELCAAHVSAMGSHPVAATLILVDELPVPDMRVMVSATAV